MSISPGELEMKLEFGLPDRLEKALKVSGVTSLEMADYLGVSRTTISNWITGKRPVKKQSLRLWALRTGVPMEWLEDGVLREGPPGDDPKGQDLPGVGAGQKGSSNLYKGDGSNVHNLWPAAPFEPVRRTA